MQLYSECSGRRLVAIQSVQLSLDSGSPHWSATSSKEAAKTRPGAGTPVPACSSAPVAAGAQTVAGLGDINDGDHLQDVSPLEGAALCPIDIIWQEGLPYLQSLCSDSACWAS